jgi:Polyketide cyclase / dehydrase and lipid transport
VKKVLLGFLALVVLGVGVVLLMASRQPATFRVERATHIDAWPGVVFANLEDFHRWEAWSPWEKLDPQMHKEYSGAPKGAGAVYAWQGKGGAGKGKMTMLQARENDLLRIRLQFFEPFPADNRVTFTLDNVGHSTEVHWIMEGTNSFMGKVMSVFADMDHLIGGDFERGLANLKQVAERAQPR